MKRVIHWLLVFCILLTLLPLPAATAAPPDDVSVYIRKHVSILYDNSGSMKEKIPGEKNLRWCYASYAAQMFAGLLNYTDTLNITFMKGNPLDQLKMDGPRQDVVSQILASTAVAEAWTPGAQIDSAVSVLRNEGLRAGAGANDGGEQFWLVLTTDGRFQDSNKVDLKKDLVAEKILEILDEYPDLHLVYFGIGMRNAKPNAKPYDFRDGSDLSPENQKLLSCANFTAVYAESQEQIVETMQSLSNQISGRYSITQQVEVSGEQVSLYLSGEGSPIRNIALMAQETNARLLSATAEDGTPLMIDMDAEIRYPYNASYDNVPDGTLGGYVALITGPEKAKVPNGMITLNFSEPVDNVKLALMYEPAIYVRLQIERKQSDGSWEAVPENVDLVEGDEIRVVYAICEDGTNRELDTDKLFGRTEATILFNGEALQPEQTVVVEPGDSQLDVFVSMMDGGYQISATRTIRVVRPGAGDLSVRSSGPLELRRSAVASNTDGAVEFSVFFRGEPVDASYTPKLSLKVSGSLAGAVENPEPHILRFVPKDDSCKAGTYTAQLFYEDKEIAAEEIRVLPNETTYTAEAGQGVSILSNQTASNKEAVRFTVTAHRDEGDEPITAAEASLFTVKADGGGNPVAGRIGWEDGGVITFTLQDADAAPGSYEVSLWKGGDKLAQAGISILHYDATYTIETVVTEPNTVNRFALNKNTAGVHFIVYEDGVPVGPEQLEAMLNRQLLVSTDLTSSYVRMDVSVGTENGKPALICTPVSSTRSGLIRYFRHVLMSFGVGGLARDTFEISLKVDMLHGGEASGQLDLTGYNPLPLVSFLIILVILVLIAMFILANLRAIRLKPGFLWSFSAAPAAIGKTRGYRIDSKSEKRVGMGIRFMLVPVDEKHSFKGLKFSAQEPSKSRRWLRRSAPKATVTGTADELSTYFYETPIQSRTDLLNQIYSGTTMLNASEFATLTGAPSALLPAGEKHARTDSVTKTQSMMSGVVLYRRIGQKPPEYQFWCYSSSTKREARKKKKKRR